MVNGGTTQQSRVTVLLIFYTLSAAALWTVTGEMAQRRWAMAATPAYAFAAVLSFIRPTRRAAPWIALIGAVLAPLIWLVATGSAQPEVQVIRDGAAALIADGTPYDATPETLYDYRPYLPALFLFGIPPGPIGDIRLLGSVVLLAAVTYTAQSAARPRPEASSRTSAAAGGPGSPARRASTTSDALNTGPRARIDLGHWAGGSHAMLLAFPVVALALVGSGIDAPQAAFTILAVALLRKRPTAAAVLTGLTIAMKPTGLCVLFVALLAVRARSGNRQAIRFAVAALATSALLVVPVVAVSPGSFVENVLDFPAGRSPITSPAESPFPGVLLRQHDAPTILQYGLVLVAVLAFALWCLRRVTDAPRNVAAHMAAGLTLAFLVVPYSRAGYLMLPALIWLSVEFAERPAAELDRSIT